MSSAASRPPKSVSPSVEPISMGSNGAQVSASTSSNSQSNGQNTSQGKSNAQHSSQNASSEHSSESDKLQQPPNRPSLMKPPARPKPPKPAPTATPAATPTAAVTAPPEPEPEVNQRPGPIAPPSEPMQYRAIGLLKGKYAASEEQFNRGNLITSDGTEVDAVLLGRVTSLIKKHIDLETEHLWVVYPRTLYKEEEPDESDERIEKIPALHVQIVGVWEPETLNADEEGELEDKERPLSTTEAEEQCDYFSVRGEVAKYSEEKNEILVNIVQKSKSETAKPKRPFKLLISGQLSGRTVGYFWEMDVKREEGGLILQKGKAIAVVPPKKKPKGKKKRRKMVGKPKSSGAPKPKPKKTTDSEATKAPVGQSSEVPVKESKEIAAVETPSASE